VFGGALLYAGGLSFPLQKDEHDHWRMSQFFAAHWPPSLEQIRSYPEPATPLSFLLWASLQVAFGGGPAAGRFLCLVLSITSLCLIGLRPRGRGRNALLAICGLLLYPYYVPLSILLYTDIPAAFFVVVGFWLYAHRCPVWSAVAFTLSIATRQYMVTFPIALAAVELAPAFAGRSGWKLQRALPLVVAAGSLLGWMLLFGDLAPAAGLQEWPRHTVSLHGLVPGYGLYFLSCIGAYFVVPEFVLYRRWRSSAALLTKRNTVLAVVVIALFAIFPPLSPDVPMGVFNRLTLVLFPTEVLGSWSETIRYALFCTLAWLTCVRFARIDLVFWLLLTNFALMTASYAAWEKYNLAVLATLWYLRSIQDLDRPIDLWSAI
jgi:hypothetical protein